MTDFCHNPECWRPVFNAGLCSTCFHSVAPCTEVDHLYHSVEPKPTPWLLTRSGRDIEFFNPTPNDISIEDIAVSLSRKARFNGHTIGRVEQIYSVAQHSCHVHDRIAEEFPTYWGTRLWALLNDAPEAYLPDVHPQLKDLIPGFRQLETVIKAAIQDRFGLPVMPRSTIKHVDLRMQATEKRDLMPYCSRLWGTVDDVEPYPDRLSLWGLQVAYNEFLFRYKQCVELMK